MIGIFMASLFQAVRGSSSYPQIKPAGLPAAFSPCTEGEAQLEPGAHGAKLTPWGLGAWVLPRSCGARAGRCPRCVPAPGCCCPCHPTCPTPLPPVPLRVRLPAPGATAGTGALIREKFQGRNERVDKAEPLLPVSDTRCQREEIKGEDAIPGLPRLCGES